MFQRAVLERVRGNRVKSDIDDIGLAQNDVPTREGDG